MSALGPEKINLTFNGLLQVPGGITSALQTVQDGNGNPTGLSISSTGISGSTSSTFVPSRNGTQYTNSVQRLISDGFGDYVSVKDFGAIGNGTTDDTTAVQNAINSLSTNGGALYFPIGRYRLTSTITLKPNVSIIGEQKGEWGSPNVPGVVFIKDHTTGDVLYSPATQTIASVSFENFYIEGNKGGIGGSSGNGIQILNCHDVIFRRVWIKECPSSGFIIGQGASSHHNYLYNCYSFFNVASGYDVQSDWMRFIDCWADGNYVGINFPNNAYCGSHARIDRCHFEEWELAAIALRGNPAVGLNGDNIVLNSMFFSRPYSNTWPAHGIFIDSSTAAQGCTANQFKGNFFFYQSTYGPTKAGHFAFYFFGGQGGSNIVEDNAISGFERGIQLNAGSTKNTFRGNYIYGCDYAIVNAAYNTIISENVCEANTIDITSTGTYGIISGNNFTSTATLDVTDYASINTAGSIGNWTPSLTFGGASTGITYSSRSGRFEKNGKTITAYAEIVLSSKGSAAGIANINIPIAAKTGITYANIAQMVSGSTGLTGNVSGYVNPSNSLFYITQGAGTSVTDANFTNNTTLLVTMIYESA